MITWGSSDGWERPWLDSRGVMTSCSAIVGKIWVEKEGEAAEALKQKVGEIERGGADLWEDCGSETFAGCQLLQFVVCFGWICSIAN